jgi:hypothetical protein
MSLGYRMRLVKRENNERDIPAIRLVLCISFGLCSNKPTFRKRFTKFFERNIWGKLLLC